MKLNGLKEERYVNKIAPKDTKMYLEVMFWSHESFVGLYLLDLENETFSQYHLYNKFRTIFDFKRIFGPVWGSNTFQEWVKKAQELVIFTP